MIRRSCAVAVQAFAMLALVQAASAQTVDELIAKNLQAKGGEAALKGVQTIRQTASMAIQGIEGSVTMLTKRPNMSRQEMSIAGQQVVMAFDGTTAWTINPMRGMAAPTALPEMEAAMLKDQSSFDGPLMDYKSTGTTITFEGTETVSGRQMHKLKVTPKSGMVQDVFLDATTGLEARVVVQTPMGEMMQEMSDYREVSGLKVPFSIRAYQGGQPVFEIKLTNVEFNVPIDDALFKMK